MISSTLRKTVEGLNWDIIADRNEDDKPVAILETDSPLLGEIVRIVVLFDGTDTDFIKKLHKQIEQYDADEHAAANIKGKRYPELGIPNLPGADFRRDAQAIAEQLGELDEKMQWLDSHRKKKPAQSEQ